MKQARAAGIGWVVNLLTLAFILLFSVSLSAQQSATKTVTGRVISVRTDSAVAEATVLVKGTSNAVTTGARGDFRIQAKAGDVLVVSFIGYKNREVKLGENDKNLNITLY